MKFIIMLRDECGQERRGNDEEYADEADALCDLLEVRQDNPEAQIVWVETLKDQTYWMQHPEEEILSDPNGYLDYEGGEDYPHENW